MHSVALKILDFWFEESKSIQWFKKDIEYDNLIKKKFIKDHNAAIKGDYKNWKESPYESLAFIILLDQFSRNIYRNKNNYRLPKLRRNLTRATYSQAWRIWHKNLVCRRREP